MIALFGFLFVVWASGLIVILKLAGDRRVDISPLVLFMLLLWPGIMVLMAIDVVAAWAARKVGERS